VSFSHPSVDDFHSAQCPPCLKPIQSIPAIQLRSDSRGLFQTLHFPQPHFFPRTPSRFSISANACCPLHPLHAKYQMQPAKKKSRPYARETKTDQMQKLCPAGLRTEVWGIENQEAKQVCMDFNLRNLDAVAPWICTFCDVMCVCVSRIEFRSRASEEGESSSGDKDEIRKEKGL
jgi:hypothetical protein